MSDATQTAPRTKGPAGETGPTSIKNIWRRARKLDESLRTFARRIATSTGQQPREMVARDVARRWLACKSVRP